MKLAYPEPAESRSHNLPKPYLHIHPSVTKTFEELATFTYCV
jgi:hypothetical protein